MAEGKVRAGLKAERTRKYVSILNGTAMHLNLLFTDAESRLRGNAVPDT